MVINFVYTQPTPRTFLVYKCLNLVRIALVLPHCVSPKFVFLLSLQKKKKNNFNVQFLDKFNYIHSASSSLTELTSKSFTLIPQIGWKVEPVVKLTWWRFYLKHLMLLIQCWLHTTLGGVILLLVLPTCPLLSLHFPSMHRKTWSWNWVKLTQ